MAAVKKKQKMASIKSLRKVRPTQIYAGVAIFVLYMVGLVLAVHFMPEHHVLGTDKIPPITPATLLLVVETFAVISGVFAVLAFRGSSFMGRYFFICFQLWLLVSTTPMFLELHYYPGLWVSTLFAIVAYLFFCEASNRWYRLIDFSKKNNLPSNFEEQARQYVQGVGKVVPTRPALVTWLAALVAINCVYFLLSAFIFVAFHGTSTTLANAPHGATFFLFVIAPIMSCWFLYGFYKGISSITIVYLLLWVALPFFFIISLFISSGSVKHFDIASIISLLFNLSLIVSLIAIAVLRFMPSVRKWYVDCGNARRQIPKIEGVQA